jgi:3-methyladenine DNA glycosylase AlkD
MDLNTIMEQLEILGTPQIKNILINHGVCEPLFGVRIGDMKKLVKHVKKNDDLAKELYNTGNYDAMYLAGLSINPSSLTKEEIKEWLQKASCDAISDYIVAGVAAESKFALELAREWTKSENERISSCGWSTYSNYISITDDSMIDMDEVIQLLDFIQSNIHEERNSVKYNMNGFVISVGAYISDLNTRALQVAKAIGKVEVFMGNTCCKVPVATSYIEKIMDKSKVGNKRKRCIC